MAGTGVLIELENGMVKETSLGVMTAAAGSSIHALVLDEDVSNAKDTLTQYGAQKIVVIKGGENLNKNPELQAQALIYAIDSLGLDALLATAGAIGGDLMARVAAIKDEPLVTDCVAVNIGEKSVKKSHFSGKTFATLKVDSPVFLCTIRPNSIESAVSPSQGEVVELMAQVKDAGQLEIIDVKRESKSKLELTEASIVITGGRAIKAAENYSMLEACAQKLGAAVGASRAAVDAGYAPHSMQVGQTGKTVSPKLYIACGVSGAVQHFAGMRTSKIIVAINEDKDAPIFAKCDYGIIGDIFDVVPKLTEKL